MNPVHFEFGDACGMIFVCTAVPCSVTRRFHQEIPSSRAHT